MAGTPDPEIVQITQVLNEVIATQDGNIFGNTEVFLRSDRSLGKQGAIADIIP